MSDAVMLRDTGYTLAEAAILSQPWLSTSTLPDALARPAVVNTAAEPAAPVLRKVVIRKRGTDLSVEVHSSGPLPRTFVKSVAAVAEILSLGPGWNSYSAKPVAPQSAIRAIRLLAELVGPATPAPFVVPRVQGGLQLEWHTGSVDIEVYITSPDAVSFFAGSLESGETIEGPLAGCEDVLKAWVQRLSISGK